MFAFTLAAVLALGLAGGCAQGGSEGGSDSGEPIANYLDSDTQAILDGSAALPVAVIYDYSGEGGTVSYPYYGGDIVASTVDALKQVTVVGEADEFAEDAGTALRFIAEDGLTAGTVSFNMGNLEYNGSVYRIANDEALWSLPFPTQGYGTGYLKDVMVSTSVAEFANRIQTEEPTALKVTENGQTREIGNAEQIAGAAQAFLNATVESTQQYEGDKAADGAVTMVFTMADGTEYSFDFVKGALIYSFPSPLGNWAYYCDEFDNIEAVVG